MSYMENLLDEFTDYLGKLRRLDLYSDLENNKTELYDRVMRLFKQEKDNLGLQFITDFGYLIVGDRISMWKFKTGSRLDLIESKKSPIISLEAIGEDYLRNKTNFLVHQIKENLGVELSYKY